MNDITWPTAIVTCVLIGCMTLLASLGVGDNVTSTLGYALASFLGFGFANVKGIANGKISKGKGPGKESAEG